MTTEEFTEAIGKRLNNYGPTHSPSGAFSFLASRRAGLLGETYSLTIRELTESSLRSQVESARSEAAALLRLHPLRQGGLNLILVGPESFWAEECETVGADKTGFHLMIIQSLFFIDPSVQRIEKRDSNWGPLKFGDTQSISQLLESMFSSRS